MHVRYCHFDPVDAHQADFLHSGVMQDREQRAQKVLRALAVRVRELRLANGISQEELAHRAGLHRTYVSDIERGMRNIALTNLVRLADALHTPLPDLFVGDVFSELPSSGRE